MATIHEHPHWCDRDHCAAPDRVAQRGDHDRIDPLDLGYHASAPIDVTGKFGDVGFQVRVWQHADDPADEGEPRIELIARRTDTRSIEGYPLADAYHAELLAAALRQAIHLTAPPTHRIPVGSAAEGDTVRVDLVDHGPGTTPTVCLAVNPDEPPVDLGNAGAEELIVALTRALVRNGSPEAAWPMYTALTELYVDGRWVAEEEGVFRFDGPAEAAAGWVAAGWREAVPDTPVRVHVWKGPDRAGPAAARTDDTGTRAES